MVKLSSNNRINKNELLTFKLNYRNISCNIDLSVAAIETNIRTMCLGYSGKE